MPDDAVDPSALDCRLVCLTQEAWKSGKQPVSKTSNIGVADNIKKGGNKFAGTYKKKRENSGGIFDALRSPSLAPMRPVLSPITRRALRVEGREGDGRPQEAEGRQRGIIY